MSSRSNGILSCSVSFPVLKREEAFFSASKNIKDHRSLLLNATWSFYVFRQLHLENHEGCLGSGIFSWVRIKFTALVRTVALREPEIVLRVRRRLAEASHLSPASDAANLTVQFKQRASDRPGFVARSTKDRQTPTALSRSHDLAHGGQCCLAACICVPLIFVLYGIYASPALAKFNSSPII